MPKDTFHQISPEKQRRIINAAATLFSQKGFERTDVARIAQKAGVAKGSMYNYFNTKEELFLHVCRDGLNRFRQAVYGGMPAEWDIFEQIDHIFKQGEAFARLHPEFVLLYQNVTTAGLNHLADELVPEMERYFADHFKQALARGVRLGVVRPDIDVNLAAFLINSLFMTYIVALVSRPHLIRIREYLDLDPVSQRPDPGRRDSFAPVVELIRGLISNPET